MADFVAGVRDVLQVLEKTARPIATAKDRRAIAAVPTPLAADSTTTDDQKRRLYAGLYTPIPGNYQRPLFDFVRGRLAAAAHTLVSADTTSHGVSEPQQGKVVHYVNTSSS